MISKDEVIQKLKKMGYQVAEDSSVVTVLIPASTSPKTTVKDLKNKLLAMGYTASFGVKQYKGEKDSFDTKSEQLESEELEDVYEEEEAKEDAPNDENEDAISDLTGESGIQFSLEDFGIGF